MASMVVVPPRRNQSAVAAAGGEQCLGGSLAGLGNGGPYAAAGCRDLGVGGAFDAAFELVGAVAREYRMRVSVDKAGKHDASAGIDDFGIRGACLLDFRARTHRDNLSVAYPQRAIRDDCQLAHGGTRARTGRARQGNNLAAVQNSQISLHPSACSRSATALLKASSSIDSRLMLTFSSAPARAATARAFATARSLPNLAGISSALSRCCSA